MSLKNATILLMLMTLLARFLGVGREMVIAWKFGASASSDAFFIAYSIPFAFYSIVGVSLTAVIVPILAEYDAAGETASGLRVASSALNIVVLISALLAGIGIVFSQRIAAVMGGNFPPATLDLATHLTALMIPTIVFMSMAGVVGGILNNYKIYIGPAAGPVLMNAIAIASMVLADRMGIEAPVLGTVVGALCYALCQIPGLRKVGFRYSLKIAVGDKTIRRIFTSTWSVMAVSCCYYAYNLTDFNLASGMPAGSITALNYATKFIQLPQGLFTLAVTTVIFSPLSAYAARNEFDNVRMMLEKGIRAILLMAVPCSAALLVVGGSVMMILFQHGRFDASATEMSTRTLIFLTVGLAGFCLNLPLIRCFYALGKQRIPLMIAMASIPIKIGLSLKLGEIMMERGLALATSLTYIINAVVMVVMLRRFLPGLLGRAFGAFALRLSAASTAMLAVTWLIDSGLALILPPTHLGVFVRLASVGAVAVATFGVFGFLFGIEELTGNLSRVVRWLVRFVPAPVRSLLRQKIILVDRLIHRTGGKR